MGQSNHYVLIALQLCFVVFAVLYFLDIASLEPVQSVGYSLARHVSKYSIGGSSSDGNGDQNNTETESKNESDSEGEVSNGLNFCPLPHYDPFDPQLKGVVDFRFPENFRNCTKSNFTKLSKYEKGVVSVNTTLACKARCFTQVEYHRKNNQTAWQNITEGRLKLDCEFVEVYCAKPDNLTDIRYAMLHYQLKPLRDKPKPRITENKVYNVYIIVLDSTGATAADRNLPLTMRFMEKSLQAVTFPYINKVGKNSRPNAVAWFLGKQIEDIDRLLTGKPAIKADWKWDESCHKNMDNETSIFHQYKDAGYRTLITDDYHIGILNYPNCKGWTKPVTDHSFDAFIHETLGAPQKANYYGKNCQLLHKEDISFLKQFVDAYPDDPQFAVTWVSEVVHDYGEGAMVMDVDIATFLMENRKKMDDSFVIIMADHGNRLTRVIWTDIGQNDINNPMLIMSVPKDLRTEEILSTMKENAAKLQTHYDTRATLLDILQHQPLSNYTDRDQISMEGEKGHSFLRKQEGERNCATLPIPFTYCMCKFKMKKEESDSAISIAAGKAVIDVVNNRLESANLTDQCNLWKFSKVDINTAYDPLEKTGAMKITVAVSWPYSKAKFKALVHRSKSGKFTIGTVDRGDRYDKRGECSPGQHEALCDCKSNKQE